MMTNYPQYPGLRRYICISDSGYYVEKLKMSESNEKATIAPTRTSHFQKPCSIQRAQNGIGFCSLENILRRKKYTIASPVKVKDRIQPNSVVDSRLGLAISNRSNNDSVFKKE
uniref:Uncharacterized protein n=1 Tax=Spongospora subterranea TaxID=70186 RepID=A0A0H5RC56_9EUKA|eukprot:CRZ11192.1 hypothetical protein [Spongospora subterranea]